MKEKFIERVTQALTIKCSDLDKMCGDRMKRIINEYDEEFSIAFKIKDSGLKFMILKDKILLDDTTNEAYPFVYDRRTKSFDSVMNDDRSIDTILDYLQIADGFVDKADEIMRGIEKRLDVLSGILSGAPSVKPAPVKTELHSTVRKPEPEPEFEDEPGEASAESKNEEWDADEPDEDEDIESVPSKNMEMGKRIVKQANGDYMKAIKVLQSLDFGEDDFTELGIPESAIDDYRALKR